MQLGPCLLAEDEALIGMALQDMLEEVGMPVAGPFASTAEALDWSRSHSPSVAVLDFALKDGPCTELALRLAAEGVPVIICSGWSPDDHARSKLATLPWLEKPFGRADLLKAIAAVAPAFLQRIQKATGPESEGTSKHRSFA